MRPTAYYRWTLQQVRRLPEAERGYYAQYARTQFTGHGDEIEPERIKEIAMRGLSSAKWVLEKYGIALENLPVGVSKEDDEGSS
jgi:hypothetical protein